METTQYTTFWKFLSNQRIEIPIIQRDYAQGRSGHEKLREKFLKDLKFALDNPVQKLKLDFVYGSLEDEKLQPLDGQQRLTTLWLLHWFIAYKAGKLHESSEMFKRFSYETRTSSREFCRQLSEFNLKQPEGKEIGIVGHIQNQTWFYSAWKQDPTIQAMLTMLGGSDVKEKDVDIIDGIEELFKDKFEEYWKILKGVECPIIFYYMPLSELKLSDDLYIKMNARGKPLTSFENFKADLTGFLKIKKEENIEVEKWNLLDIDDFEHKLDTDWTNIFWKNRSAGYKIDEIFFAFFNRYFFNCLAIKKDAKDDSKSYKYLYGTESNDNSVVFLGFDIYESIAEDPIMFSRISKILNNFTNSFKNSDKDQINSLFNPNWTSKNDFKFIPEYADEKSITTLTKSQRAVFHAICKYFENSLYEEVSFKRWMRVVWNIIENANIDSPIGVIRLIDELGGTSTDIYTHLKDRDISNDFAKGQMEEEKEKARQIIDNPEWEGKIIEAEKTAFFNGAIRFLFRTDADKYDWSLFDLKLSNCKKYFDSKGVKDDDKKFKSDAILLKAIICRCSDFVKYVWWDKYIFDNKAETWKENLLLKKEWANAVNELLQGELNIKQINTSLLYRNLFETNLLKYVSQEMPGARMRWIHGHHAIYPPYKEGILLDDKDGNYCFKRNEVLSFLLSKKIISTKGKVSNCDFFWGWDIDFKFETPPKTTTFQWNRDNKIYVLENGYCKKKTGGNDYEMFEVNPTTPEPYNELQDWMKQICDQN